MTAKEILTRPKTLKMSVRAEMDNLIALRAMAESCTSHMKLTGSNHQQGQRSGLESITIRLAEEEKKLNDILTDLAAAEGEALELIRMLEKSEQRAVLMCRYIQERTWKDVAKACFIGRTTALACHRDALQQLDRLLAQQQKKKEDAA
ncbi:MAG: DUF1492 domain-containing protein [Oscillospiraceae bacterium]|nr:DUF1492 domain-containing protein [Oscillospiraceae bacterium]